MFPEEKNLERSNDCTLGHTHVSACLSRLFNAPHGIFLTRSLPMKKKNCGEKNGLLFNFQVEHLAPITNTLSFHKRFWLHESTHTDVSDCLSCLFKDPGSLLDKVTSSSLVKMVFLSAAQLFFVLNYSFNVVSSTTTSTTPTNPTTTSTSPTTTSTSLLPSASIPTFPSCLQPNISWAAEASVPSDISLHLSDNSPGIKWSHCVTNYRKCVSIWSHHVILYIEMMNVSCPNDDI